MDDAEGASGAPGAAPSSYTTVFPIIHTALHKAQRRPWCAAQGSRKHAGPEPDDQPAADWPTDAETLLSDTKEAEALVKERGDRGQGDGRHCANSGASQSATRLAESPQ